MDEIIKEIFDNQKVILKVLGKEVNLDAKNLFFNEATLNEYIQKEGAMYNRYGQCLADAQAEWQLARADHEVLYSQRFKEFKQGGATEKLAEAHSKADPDVIKANKRIIAKQRVVESLKNHLKAWDKNHDNAQALGHMMRKEMDKLGLDIKWRNDDFKVQELMEGGANELQ